MLYSYARSFDFNKNEEVIVAAIPEITKEF